MRGERCHVTCTGRDTDHRGRSGDGEADHHGHHEPATDELAPESQSVTEPTTSPDAHARPGPPKPTGVTFDQQYGESDTEGVADHTQTVTWRTPRSDGVEIRVYGVTECIARPEEPAPGTRGPCLVAGTPLPASVRTLLGTAAASAGVVSWSWREGGNCDTGLAHDPDRPGYASVVLAAYYASGHSIFAIAEPGLWFQPDGNDTVC